jgi:O-antigen ligase
MGNVEVEGSAMGRVAAWKWTIGYVSDHPFGGSFDVFRINRFELELRDGTLLDIAGKAFHSIYFEILGELGVPGLVLFLLIVAVTILTLLTLKNNHSASHAWSRDASLAILMAMIIYLVGGIFIGVAFQPYFYYLVAISVGLRNASEDRAPPGTRGYASARISNGVTTLR